MARIRFADGVGAPCMDGSVVCSGCGALVSSDLVVGGLCGECEANRRRAGMKVVAGGVVESDGSDDLRV
jgi:hypothetical protein